MNFALLTLLGKIIIIIDRGKIMQKVQYIKNMADCILTDENKCISPEEFEMLMALSESQIEKELYINLYNFFLSKKSEEVIKNGRF